MTMEALDLVQGGWYVGTFLYCLVAGLVPFLSSEAFLLWLAVSAPREHLWALLGTACLAQMLGKSVVFAAGRGAVRLPVARDSARLESVRRRIADRRGRGSWLAFASALTGVPPFYWLTLAGGALGWRFAPFFLAGLAGRVLRFSAVMFLPQNVERGWIMDVGASNLTAAAVIGLLAGAHTATWGMYKDSPYEGFTWRKYARSLLIAAGVSVVWEVFLRLDLAQAPARLLLFGLAYVAERGLVELYKTCFREEDQSKYAIPMQLAFRGHVIQSRAVRWSVAAGWLVVLALLASGASVLQSRPDLLAPSAALILFGSVGGWISAFGGAYKDAPVEGFDTLKFFRSPLIALLWSLLVSSFTDSYVLVALCSLGYTIATIETYKTFFFPNVPRGKWAGKPLRHVELVQWRYRFAPLYVAIWAVLLGHVAVAMAQPPPLAAGM